jgi:hypothetical protein
MDGKFVLVETEEGFPVGYLPGQIVLISTPPTASKPLDQHPAKQPAPNRPRGLYFLIDPPGHDGFSQLNLANCLPYALYYVLAEQQGKYWQSTVHGHLPPGQFNQLVTRRFSDANHWAPTELRILPCGNPVLTEYMAYPLKINPKKFLDSLAQAPVKGGLSYVLKLDGDAAGAQSFVQKDKPYQAPVGPVSVLPRQFVAHADPVPSVVDLHLDKLPKGEKMGNKDMALSHQLTYARQMIERAVAQDKKEITFIHGVGEGVLKTALEQICREHPHVASCCPANQELYGNGAMVVKLN